MPPLRNLYCSFSTEVSPPGYSAYNRRISLFTPFTNLETKAILPITCLSQFLNVISKLIDKIVAQLLRHQLYSISLFLSSMDSSWDVPQHYPISLFIATLSQLSPKLICRQTRYTLTSTRRLISLFTKYWQTCFGTLVFGDISSSGSIPTFSAGDTLFAYVVAARTSLQLSLEFPKAPVCGPFYLLYF